MERKNTKNNNVCNIAYNVVRDIRKKHKTMQPKSNTFKAKKP
jgi:CRISPR/Cas system CMR-associated protein Cmr5 small subunit